MGLYGNVGSIIGTVGGAFLGPIGAAVGGTVGSLTGNLIEGLKKPKYETITQRSYLNNNPYQGYLYGQPALERKETYLRQEKQPSQAYQRAEQAMGILSTGVSTAASFMNPEAMTKATEGIKGLFKTAKPSIPSLAEAPKEISLFKEQPMVGVPEATPLESATENILERTRNLINSQQRLRWNFGMKPKTKVQIPQNLIPNFISGPTITDPYMPYNPNYNYFNLY